VGSSHTGAGPTTRSIAAAVLLVLAWILSGCGSPDSAAPVSQAYPIETPTPTPTPTLSPLNATKQAIDERMEHELQTAVAGPTSGTLPPLPTDQPTSVPPTGFRDHCDTLTFTNRISETNCWADLVGNEYFFFVAGADTANPAQGTVGFYTAILNEPDVADSFATTTPTEHGAVTIIAANPPRFTLEAADGTQFVFNVETRQWEEPPYPGP